jgi:hypothetical protein
MQEQQGLQTQDSRDAFRLFEGLVGALHELLFSKSLLHWIRDVTMYID